jgi:hypothetical protein
MTVLHSPVEQDQGALQSASADHVLYFAAWLWGTAHSPFADSIGLSIFEPL